MMLPEMKAVYLVALGHYVGLDIDRLYADDVVLYCWWGCDEFVMGEKIKVLLEGITDG